MTVAVEGTSFTAQTDATGSWKISNLPAGTYVISFTKPGYREQKVFDQRFFGGGESYITKTDLYQEMNYGTITITTVTVASVDSGNSFRFDVEGTVEVAAPYQRALRLYIGTDATVSEESRKYFYESGILLPAGATAFTYTRRFMKEEFDAMKPTWPAYAIVYPPLFSNEYYDPRVDSTVITGRRDPPSSVVQMILQ